MLWSPTIRAALIAWTPWLDVFCPDCGTSRAIDLRTVDRHPLASVGTLVLGLRCSGHRTLLQRGAVASAASECGDVIPQQRYRSTIHLPGDNPRPRGQPNLLDIRRIAGDHRKSFARNSSMGGALAERRCYRRATPSTGIRPRSGLPWPLCEQAPYFLGVGRLGGSTRLSLFARAISANAAVERRTPGLSPFVNSIPAVSKAFTNAATVEACAAKLPGLASRRFNVGSDTEEASASWRCSHRSRALAARISSLVMIGLGKSIPQESIIILQVLHRAHRDVIPPASFRPDGEQKCNRDRSAITWV
jgi:hypothetical protein